MYINCILTINLSKS